MVWFETQFHLLSRFELGRFWWLSVCLWGSKYADAQVENYQRGHRGQNARTLFKHLNHRCIIRLQKYDWTSCHCFFKETKLWATSFIRAASMGISNAGFSGCNSSDKACQRTQSLIILSPKKLVKSQKQGQSTTSRAKPCFIFGSLWSFLA